MNSREGNIVMKHKIFSRFVFPNCRNLKEGTLFYNIKISDEAVICRDRNKQSTNRFGLENTNLNPADGATMVVVSKSLRFLLRGG